MFFSYQVVAVSSCFYSTPGSYKHHLLSFMYNRSIYRVTRLQKLYENILSNRGSGNNNEQVYDGCLSQVALNFCDIFSKKKCNTAAFF